MIKRPTRRAGTLVLVALLLVGAGTTAQAGWLFVLAAGSLGLVVGSWLIPTRLSSVEITRSHPGRVRVGDEVPVEVRARATERVGPVRMRDGHPAFEEMVGFAASISRDEVRVQGSRWAIRRGIFAGGPVELLSAAPFGMSRSKRTIDVASPVVVTPRWAELDSFPLLEPASFPSETLHERARTGGGQDYLGVREFRSGDPLRHIHWRSSARAGQLIVREYSERVRSRVLVVLTGPDHGAPPDSAFETAVSAAASVVFYALTTGHPVDLARPRENGGVERIGDVDRIAALEWLADAPAVDVPASRVLAPALVRAGRRATVVLVTTTGGKTVEGLAEAVGDAQAAGARAIVVAISSRGWDGPDDARGLGALGRRAVLRVIDRGADLKRSLER